MRRRLKFAEDGEIRKIRVWSRPFFPYVRKQKEWKMSSISNACRSSFKRISPKTSGVRDLNSLPCLQFDKETMEYFILADLWDCYDEWSAYGTGVPIFLNRGETLFQYYVPYLSAIQIYTTKSFTSFRNPIDDSDVGEFESDSWSDDNETNKLSRSLSNNSSRGWDVAS